jgi:hypothetical protein
MKNIQCNNDNFFKVEKYKQNSFITCDSKGEITIYEHLDMRTGEKRSLSTRVLDFYFRDSHMYAVNNRYELLEFESTSLKLLKTVKLSDRPTSVNVSENGTYIAYTLEDELYVIELSSGRQFKLECDEIKLIQLCFDFANKFLVGGSACGDVLIFRLDLMSLVKRLEFSTSISFRHFNNIQFSKSKNVISWHADGIFFSILDSKSVLYCEANSWRVNYRFNNYNLRDNEFYIALAYSTNKKYIFVLTNLNKLISYFIINSEIILTFDFFTHSLCYNFIVLETRLVLSNSDSKLYEVFFNLRSSIDENKKSVD